MMIGKEWVTAPCFLNLKIMKIFLDDIRNPEDCVKYMGERIGALTYLYMGQWLVVRNYKEFVKVVSENINEITHISFDHDLGEDIAQFEFENGLYSKRQARRRKKEVKSGYDCAKWMKDFYRSKNKQHPVMFVHSMNPVGTQNIINLFK